ncbi:MAG: S9 family peptidase [Gemmatimonadota bacterium]|nr:MAG: S9 family peptidase [Gemmatimonadota bacterium]
MAWQKSFILLLIISFGLFSITVSPLSNILKDKEPIVYPKTHKDDVVDGYHGVMVPDPYRWLEDPGSPETREWIEAQNRLTFEYLEQIPERPHIKERLTELWNYEKYDPPRKHGNRYFFEKKDGLQNQYTIYTMTSLDEEPRVLLDPNILSQDGTIALTGWVVTGDGRLMAYGLSTAGSDWQEWYVRDVGTGEDLSDHIKWIKFSEVSWTKDNNGFFYSRYDEPDEATKLQEVNYYNKLYYHQLGTPQAEDVLVYHRPDQKEWGFGGTVTSDGRYLVIEIYRSSEEKNLVFYKDLQEEVAEVVELINAFEAEFLFLDNDGPILWFKTDYGAPRGRVIAIDIRKPDPSNWREIVPQAQETIDEVHVVGDKFIVLYLKDARTQVKLFDLKGRFVNELGLPGLGTAYGFEGTRKDDEAFYRFNSYTDPGTVYRYDFKKGRNELFRRPKVDFNPEDYETKQVFFSSMDGTRVPMFITHKKGLELNGQNPTMLYGYGGFNISLTPYFRVNRIVWMEMGGVYAVANIRGGGEYGQEWHEAGMLLKKQNCFDDFIAAAEWLINNKYTSRQKLAISGASNGGTLVGACMNQRPDLFGACLPDVGVMDMLRFHKFTIGWAWVSDYGSPDNPEEFKALYDYSPLHNLKPDTTYPATLVTTSDHDDRVVPAHSFKYAAALQAAHAGSAPVLIRIQTKAGHGLGKPTTMRIEEAADVLAFLVSTLGMDID